MSLLDTLRFVGQMLTGVGIRGCEHMDEIGAFEPADQECADCRVAGARWVHLRMCMSCGYVGCCDSSSLTHMRAHVDGTGHPIVRSIEGKERWLWCYAHERLVRR